MDQYRPMDFAVIQSPQEEKHFQTDLVYIIGKIDPGLLFEKPGQCGRRCVHLLRQI